jgi:hypothetical protein
MMHPSQPVLGNAPSGCGRAVRKITARPVTGPSSWENGRNPVAVVGVAQTGCDRKGRGTVGLMCR